MSKIGFIGLGIMGKPMAKNLIKKGHELVVLNRKSSSTEELVQAGAKKASTPAEVASQVDYVITMVPNSPQVKEVVLGENGIIEGARPGTMVIDMSSIAPLVSREVGEALQAKGIRFMDAPVSGGEPKAIDGTLSIMVGGREADFEEVKEILLSMGASAVLCGEVGAGNVTKLANQIIVAVNIAAMSEAFSLATKAGVSPDLVFKAIRGGLAGSTVLEAKAPMVMDRNFNPGFRIDLHIKDMNNIMETGHELGSPLPLSASVLEMMYALRTDGHGNNDHSALAKYYEKLANLEINR